MACWRRQSFSPMQPYYFIHQCRFNDINVWRRASRGLAFYAFKITSEIIIDYINTIFILLQALQLDNVLQPIQYLKQSHANLGQPLTRAPTAISKIMERRDNRKKQYIRSKRKYKDHFKGRVSTDIGNMELWARGWSIYFSELTVFFKPQGKFFNSLYFEHPWAESAMTYYRLHPKHISQHYKQKRKPQQRYYR